MSGSIRLHPELGVNPRLTFCPRCGGEGKDLVLAGARNFKDTCQSCGTVVYGGWDKGHCPKCNGYSKTRTELEPNEKLPSSVLCDACQKEVDEQKMVVEIGGGVYFRCNKCGCSGAVRGHTDLAKAVRSAMQKQEAKNGVAPDGWWTTASQLDGNTHHYLPLGTEFDDCAYHTVAP